MYKSWIELNLLGVMDAVLEWETADNVGGLAKRENLDFVKVSITVP